MKKKRRKSAPKKVPKPTMRRPSRRQYRLGERPRGKNPRLQNMFVLYAKRGKTILKYVGGLRFSSKGRAVLFPAKADALTTARDLKSRFPGILRGYRLTIHS